MIMVGSDILCWLWLMMNDDDVLIDGDGSTDDVMVMGDDDWW